MRTLRQDSVADSRAKPPARLALVHGRVPGELPERDSSALEPSRVALAGGVEVLVNHRALAADMSGKVSGMLEQGRLEDGTHLGGRLTSSRAVSDSMVIWMKQPIWVASRLVRAAIAVYLG